MSIQPNPPPEGLQPNLKTQTIHTQPRYKHETPKKPPNQQPSSYNPIEPLHPSTLLLPKTPTQPPQTTPRTPTPLQPTSYPPASNLLSTSLSTRASIYKYWIRFCCSTACTAGHTRPLRSLSSSAYHLSLRYIAPN